MVHSGPHKLWCPDTPSFLPLQAGEQLMATAHSAGAAAAAAEARTASSGSGGGAPPAAGSSDAGADAAAVASLTQQLQHQLRLGTPAASSSVVPKELAALTTFLSDPARLSTPGLFVHSYEAVCGLPLRGRQAARSGAGMESLLAATAGLRWALDLGRPLPSWATPHQVGVWVGRGWLGGLSSPGVDVIGPVCI